MRLPVRPYHIQLAILLFYLVVALVVTWPAPASLADAFIGDSTSDAYEMAHHIWWFKHALQTGQPLFEMPALGYPDGISAVTLWANPLQFFPAWLLAFFLPLPLAYNLTILLTLALNGWAMHWLAADRLGRGQRGPALLAGLVFMAFPTFQGHLLGGHAGLMVMWPVPLYLWALFHLAEEGGRRWLWLAVLFFLLSPGGHMLQTIYVLLPVTALFVLGRWWMGDLAGGLRALGAALLGGLALLLFISPAIIETLRTPAYTDTGGYVRYSLDLLSVIAPAFDHPVYSAWLQYPHRVLGTNIVEGAAYAGLFAGVLALIGIFGRRGARWWLLLAVAAWVLALGPLLKINDMPLQMQLDGYNTRVLLPWALLQELPGFNLARTPGRFAFTLALAVAMLAAYGLATFWRDRQGIGRRHLFLALLMTAILWDYQLFSTFRQPTLPAAVPQGIVELAERPGVRAVLNLPWDNLLAAKDALYYRTWHGLPMIAGQVSRQTPVSPAKLALLQQTLDPGLLNDVGADVVIVHKQRAQESGQLASLMARARRQLGEPFYEDEQVALFSVPFSTGNLEFIRTPLPQQIDIASSHTFYFYTATPGWIDLTGQLLGSERTATLYLDGRMIHHWELPGELTFKLPVPAALRGFHTLELMIDPPCPQYYSPTLACRSVTAAHFSLEQGDMGTLYDPVHFAEHIELAAVHVPGAATDRLSVRLWWRFERGITKESVRFVHVLDANGTLAKQQDNPIDVLPAGSEWAETVILDVSELQPGSYRVLTGWYRFFGEQIVRYDVLSDVPGAQDDTVEIGRVVIEP